MEQDHDERDADENYNDSIEIWDGLKEQRDGHLTTKNNSIHGSSLKKKLLTLTKESIMDSFARSSSHLSSALLLFY